MITQPAIDVKINRHELDEEPDWDRTEWVGEGQDDGHAETAPPISPEEVRWNKWQWIGEGQGEPGPNRGRPASAMPDGESEYSGHNHVPSAEHWAGSGWVDSPRRGRRVPPKHAIEGGGGASEPSGASEPTVIAVDIEETIVRDERG